MEYLQDAEAAAAALLRYAEERSAGKVALLQRQLVSRDAEVERLSRELMDVIRSVRTVTEKFENFQYALSREAI